MLQVADMICGAGGEVRFSSSGEVAELIRSRGYDCNSLPLADVRYTEGGAFSLRETMTASPLIFARTSQQVHLEVANMVRYAPQVVLSDSSLSTVLAARLESLPVFTVLNQLNLTSSHGRISAPARLLSAGISAGMGKLWELSDEVLLPDLPPPYTISEKNLWGSQVGKTRYIGFLQMSAVSKPDAVAEEFAADGRRKVFWQVSGPPKTRASFLERGLEAAASLSEEFVFVITGGDPRDSSSPRRIPGGWYYGWCRTPETFFSLADVIVSRAGHGTIGQAIMSSKPSLLVPIPRQPEQEGNAFKAELLGISKQIRQDEVTVDRAKKAIEALLEGGSADRARLLGQYASRYRAAEEVVRTLRAAAS
jgi:UDP:flavonoid glycosyltransferase YjiC (YdhE family)